MVTTVCTLLLASLLLSALVYRVAVRRNLTADQKQRREVLYKVQPYVRPRKRDAPGQALRRAVYLAWVDRKITLAERELFAKRARSSK